MKMLITFQHPWTSGTFLLVILFSTQCCARLAFYFTSRKDFKLNEGRVRSRSDTDGYVMKFGPTFPPAPKRFEGMPVLANPENGCQSINPPPNATDINVTGKWIAVMISGGCDFVVKTRNAQNAGYQMALIHNNYSLPLTSDPCDSYYYYSLKEEYNETLNCSDSSDINIFTVNAGFSAGYYINIHLSYKIPLIIAVTDDDSDPVICTNHYRKTYEQKPVKCIKRYSKEEVPTPDTWLV